MSFSPTASREFPVTTWHRSPSGHIERCSTACGDPHWGNTCFIRCATRDWGATQGNYDELRLFTGLRPSEQIALMLSEIDVGNLLARIARIVDRPVRSRLLLGRVVIIHLKPPPCLFVGHSHHSKRRWPRFLSISLARNNMPARTNQHISQVRQGSPPGQPQFRRLLLLRLSACPRRAPSIQRQRLPADRRETPPRHQ